MELRYLAIDPALAHRFRTALIDPHGNALRVERSTDAGNPCRSCLRLTPAGTELILAAYQPSGTAGPYAEIGPVFVHARRCEPHGADSGFPADFRPRALVFRAYGDDGRIASAEVGNGVDAEAILDRLLSKSGVATVHVRNPAWAVTTFAWNAHSTDARALR